VPYKNGRVDRDAVSGTMWTLRAQGTMFWAYVGPEFSPTRRSTFGIILGRSHSQTWPPSIYSQSCSLAASSDTDYGNQFTVATLF